MRVTFTLVSREREKRGNGVKAKNPSERENRLLSRDNKCEGKKPKRKREQTVVER
jgi:hypothetical protein